MSGQSGELTQKQIKRTFTYKCEDMVNLIISYPEVSFCRTTPKINAVIGGEVCRAMRKASGEMYADAVQNYLFAQKEGYPFNTYELDMQYNEALNEGCALSLYYDTYMYTGGAHGTTPRASDTFNLCTGQTIDLKSLFPCGESYKNKILGEILKAADAEMAQNPGLFFDNYRELILENFCEQSFYLTPTGVVIYYQQYDIGPYAIGIQQFEMPYSSLGIEKPDFCKA